MAVAIVVVAASLLWSAILPAHAVPTGPGALDPESSAWNGLSRWIQSLRAADIIVHSGPDLDLQRIDGAASLVCLGIAVDGAFAEDLVRFVRRGGRLVVADETGGSDAFIDRLGLRRVPPYRGLDRSGSAHPALVVLRPAEPDPRAGSGSRSPLVDGVSHVVANHPFGLTAAQTDRTAQSDEMIGPALLFPNETGFAFHVAIEGGEVFVVADTSLFINLMLPAGDNARLLANLGAWLSEEGRREIYVAASRTKLAGRLGQQESDVGMGGVVGRLNQRLARLDAHRPDLVALRFFLALLVAAVVLYGLTVFPGGAALQRGAPERGTSQTIDRVGPAGMIDRLAGHPGAPAAPEPLDDQAPESSTEVDKPIHA